jgi:transcriptional regulator with XRE-family HTH domain
MTTDPLARPDGLHVKVAVAGYRGVLADAAGRTAWTCRHTHLTTPEARQCAVRERDVPGLADLGYRLRQLRQTAGLSKRRVAAALECSTSKVSRIETGEILPSTRDVRDLAELYRADPQQRVALMTAAREGRIARAAWAERRRQERQDHDQDGAR